jgi:hypothetical protein
MAPVYILTADFAHALLADEDPMPPDRNLHPLPCNLVHNNIMFVLPRYPEIGWDGAPFVAHEGGQAEGGDNNDNMQHDNQMGDDVQESMVLNPFENSNSSANMEVPDLNLMVQQQLNAHNPQLDILQVGRFATLFGHVLPPEMMWRLCFEKFLPAMKTANITVSLNFSPFNIVKRSWLVAFEFHRMDSW